MQKITQVSKKSKLSNEINDPIENREMQPDEDVLQRILKFAASYRVQRVDNNQFVNLFLN